MKKSILIIDDEVSLLESLYMFLSEKGYDVKTAVCASEGMEKAERLRPDAIILDIRLPDGDGLDLLAELKKRAPETGVIMITAFHDMDTTVTAIKRGATEYITKPIDVDELERSVLRAMKVTSVMKERKTSPETGVSYQKGKIVGTGKDMKEVFKTIGALSENGVTVLIEGETGTGKELIAKAIHCNSPYKEHPFLVINCSAIVSTLLESELFGHEKGSFTGAFQRKKGKFELAGEGTIFLDEVGEIPMEVQSKLLRFLQEKEFERVGGEKALYSNARVIAATNRNLWQMVRQDSFREDLYYRLSVATIKVPPLRARKGDIPLLVTHLLRKINSELHRNIKAVEEKVIRRLLDYDWPGNVRELENVLTRAAIDTHGDVIFEEFVAPLLAKTKEPAEPSRANDLARSLAAVERQHIIQVLNDTGGHLGKACEILGISRPTLRQKLKEYSIPDRLREDR
ncbi:MAG: two component system response regulator, sigma54-specific + binding [Deltaproteobacteria bacterium]|nr:two component system response regulator, sigma54-specific + binding [Deltaproteobacteria bacterium]